MLLTIPMLGGAPKHTTSRKSGSKPLKQHERTWRKPHEECGIRASNLLSISNVVSEPSIPEGRGVTRSLRAMSQKPGGRYENSEEFGVCDS